MAILKVVLARMQIRFN